jgi:large conductance mechanosensitive channel
MTVRRSRRAATGFLRDFQEFILKGNVVELAIAVIIGGAFGKIITSFTDNIIMPLLNPLLSEATGESGQFLRALASATSWVLSLIF